MPAYILLVISHQVQFHIVDPSQDNNQTSCRKSNLNNLKVIIIAFSYNKLIIK